MPAFHVDWVGPDTVTMTSPTIMSKPLVVPAGQDLQVEWTGGSQGSVAVWVESDIITPPNAATCVADATSGVIVVPAHVLQSIPHAAVLNVSVGGWVSDLVAAGDWDVELTVSATGQLPGGRPSPLFRGASVAPGGPSVLKRTLRIVVQPRGEPRSSLLGQRFAVAR